MRRVATLAVLLAVLVLARTVSAQTQPHELFPMTDGAKQLTAHGKALDAYVSGGQIKGTIGYQHINGRLRSFWQGFFPNAKVDAVIDDLAELTSAGEIPPGAVFGRRTSRFFPFAKGDTFEELGFLSLNQHFDDTLKGTLQTPAYDDFYIWRITAPNGGRGLDVPKYYAAHGAEHPFVHLREFETLVPPGAKLRITGVGPGDRVGTSVIEATLETPPGPVAQAASCARASAPPQPGTTVARTTATRSWVVPAKPTMVMKAGPPVISAMMAMVTGLDAYTAEINHQTENPETRTLTGDPSRDAAITGVLATAGDLALPGLNPVGGLQHAVNLAPNLVHIDDPKSPHHGRLYDKRTGAVYTERRDPAYASFSDWWNNQQATYTPPSTKAGSPLIRGALTARER